MSSFCLLSPPYGKPYGRDRSKGSTARKLSAQNLSNAGILQSRMNGRKQVCKRSPVARRSFVRHVVPSACPTIDSHAFDSSPIFISRSHYPPNEPWVQVDEALIRFEGLFVAVFRPKFIMPSRLQGKASRVSARGSTPPLRKTLEQGR
jgi:hypothetical protein